MQPEPKHTPTAQHLAASTGTPGASRRSSLGRTPRAQPIAYRNEQSGACLHANQDTTRLARCQSAHDLPCPFVRHTRRLLEASAAPSAPESANQSGPVAAVADSQTQRPPFPEQRDQSRDLPCGIQKADPCPQRFSVPFAPCQTTPRWRSTPVRQSARQGGPSLSLRAAAPSHNLAGLSQQQPGPVTHSYLTTTSGASVTRYREVVAECDQLTSLVRLWSPNK